MFRVLPFFLLMFLTSCSVSSSEEGQLEPSKDENIEENQEQEKASTEKLETKIDSPAPQVVKEEVSAIEIKWRAPKTNVARYILRYGKSSDNLDSEEKIKIEALKEEVHPVYGKLYKYLLIGFPSKAEIYYTLQAENEFGLSEPTSVIREEAK